MSFAAASHGVAVCSYEQTAHRAARHARAGPRVACAMPSTHPAQRRSGIRKAGAVSARRLTAERLRPQGSALAQSAAAPAISITDQALAHLQKLRAESGSDELLLRIGVKSGGCSGMSYHMDFETDANVAADDMIMNYEGGFRLVCDSKSLLYLFGMHLDFSNALIGGGFQFQNPNADSTCGCGKSFGV